MLVNNMIQKFKYLNRILCSEHTKPCYVGHILNESSFTLVQ